MAKQVVQTNNAPGAVGPYSQAVVVNGMVFTAGQIPLIPGTKDIVEGGIREQTQRVLENLKAVIEAAGSSFENAIKTTVYLKDMNDFPAMNEVYATFFTAGQEPARSTVEVARLPRDVMVEIEMIALLNAEA